MKIIPELRFPEFKNEAEWFGDTLINIAKFRRGSFPQPYGLPEWYDELNGMPFIQVYDVGDNFRLKPKTKSKISKLAAEQSVFIPKGTVIITIQGSIGRVAITQYDAYIDRTLLLFEEFYNEIDKTFFAYVLFMLFEIEKEKAPGGIIKTITKEVLSDFVINIPKLPEQQKIASCLSSLDEVIAAHSQKLDLLKDHKKGLMQNLFPQDGETVPKYRFKEFEKDGDWVEKSLIDTADKKVKWSFTGGPFGSNLKASDYTTEGIRIIQLQNIGDGEFNDDNKIFTSIEKADELLSCNIYAGDIIISKMGDPVGRACIIPETLQRCVMASDGIRLVVDEKKHSKYFIYSLINSKRIREAIEKKSTGSTRKRIGLDALREIELIIPKTSQEQQKIASCLSSLDALITAQAEKIEQLQLHKKGLMQGLFPKMSEL